VPDRRLGERSPSHIPVTQRDVISRRDPMLTADSAWHDGRGGHHSAHRWRCECQARASDAARSDARYMRHERAFDVPVITLQSVR
jgi:hypothetical protein